MNYAQILSSELGIRPAQAQAVIDLLDAGNTIPFIARYRKEAHGSLDDAVLRALAERLEYLRGLDKRREEILRSIADQQQLTDALRQKIESAATLSELEDLYRPFRPKRRTRATIARGRGLEGLAMFLRLQPMRGNVDIEAKKYLSGEVPDAASALAGARDILAEMISDDADARKSLRALMNRRGVLTSRAAKDEDSVYRLYYDYSEPVSRAQPHRILAINRGEREEFLKVSVSVPEDEAIAILNRAYVRAGSIAEGEMRAACEDAWDRLIAPSLEREARSELTDRANESAIRVFSENLYQLLMTPPIRGHATLGVDPGFRTGCKLAAIDATGKALETGVGYFTLPVHERQKEQAKRLILNMIRRHNITAIAIGNGTASRESEKFIASILPEVPGVKYMIVSEAGASVYSASELAAKEFPDYDVSLRSAVSIARRMQDPLAELVKIDPKSIGVGQYQHDLKQNKLAEALGGVVESYVNTVGVEISTASAALLEHVAGVGPALAKNIVAYREENGIPSRAALKKVPKLGAKAFEQCAGFLRVRDSANPLDATAVHPESYPVAKRLLETLSCDLKALKGGGIRDISARAQEYGLDALAKELGIGRPTLSDILAELTKPGRDPRDDLPAPVLSASVLEMSDLKPGMELTGTVRNVVDFGAFVDIGVHQDGLVHLSRMADRFIRHPSEVVKVGDVIKVWVLEVDEKKKRIALTMLRPD